MPPAITEASHTFTEHVGEVEVSLRAPDLRSLFAEAGKALADVMEARPAGGPPAGEHVAVRARDHEALLVSFLNELIYLSEMRGRVWTDVDVDRVTDTELEATIAGPPIASVAVPVKAASFHGLAIRRAAAGLEAHLVLDV